MRRDDARGKLAYKTFGTLSPAKDNAIVYPTWYSGQHTENEWLIGPGKALDPDKYFIIIPNMFGNGLSSSPSNTPAPWNGPRFPNVTAYDNVRVQHRLRDRDFGIETAGAGHRLVDGRAADLPLGRDVPRHGAEASRRSAARPSARRTITYSSRASRRR